MSQRELSREQRYTYNGKESITDLDLGWLDFGARMYQADLGRWFNIDPLSEYEGQENMTLYHYGFNNPLRFIDPTGMLSTDVVDNQDGTFTVVGGDANDGDKTIYVVTQNEQGEYTRTGEVIGESITTHSFFDENEQAVVGAVIDPYSSEGQDFIDNEIIEDSPGLLEYMVNARSGEDLDFKERGIESAVEEGKTEIQHRYRGSLTKDGKIGSARDFGNIAAGIVTGKSGLSWGATRIGFDSYQSYKSGSITSEAITSKKAQKIGYKIGVSLRPPAYAESQFSRFGEN